MISLTRKSDYALVGVAGLAAAGGDHLSARELAERLRLPLPALRNILKDLVHVGLVASEQGAQGGYRLARDASLITVADVVEAIEGAAKLTPCCHDTPPGRATPCRLESSCHIKASIRALHDRLNDVLRRTTIADLLEASGPSPERIRSLSAAGPRGLSISTE